MKTRFCQDRCRRADGGFTLIEMMTSVGVGALLLVVVAILFINGSLSFVAMGNYQNLDAKSTKTLDILSQEIRNATALNKDEVVLPGRDIRLALRTRF